MENDFDNRQQNRWEERRGRWQQRWDEKMERRSKHGHIWSGIFILLIGVAALVRISVPDLPHWLFSWKTFLIALGLFIGVKHGFKGIAWIVLIVLGSYFIARDVYPEIGLRQYFWPIALIGLGIFLIVKPRNRHWSNCYEEQKTNKQYSTAEKTTVINETFDSKEDFVDVTSIFGGTKKNIISKNFRGGDLVNIFGGTELDLTRADFTGTATLEVTNIFGGTKLIIPSDWALRSEAVTIFGGLEDKRNMQGVRDNPDKVLILRGTVLLGGIDIKSF
jgi:predicted membrane protein